VTEKLRLVSDAREGLAFEQSLFDATGPQVGLWATLTPGLVCPRRFQTKPNFDQTSEHLASLGWPVHLRTTGGGTVPQGPGVVNLAMSFNAPPDFALEDGYRTLVAALTKGLSSTKADLLLGDVPGSFCDGKWNLAIDGKKVIGTAQRWRPDKGKGSRVLAHAMILTEDTFQAGTDAVATFHRRLGLTEIRREVHTSLSTATGLTDLPIAELYAAARDACQFESGLNQ